jgi:hypothetical protein
MSRQQFQHIVQENNGLKESLQQAQYESQNLREILEAYQEHVQSARPADVEPASSKTSKKEVESLKEQLSITSSRNAVFASEINAQKIENKSLRDIMDAMREDLVLAHEKEQHVESEHEERLSLLAEQLEKLKKNAKGARSDKRKAERKMDDVILENATLNEQIASQEVQLLAVTSEQSDFQAETLLKAKEQANSIKQQLRDAEARERNIVYLLELFERQGMEKEDLLTQHAELYQLEAELRSIRQAEEEEKSVKGMNEANLRARDAEQRLAEEMAGKIKAEKDRDSALQQLSIIHERFGIVDRSGMTFGYGSNNIDTNEDANSGGFENGGLRNRGRSDSITSSTCTSSSNLERRFKLIQEGGDITHSLLSHPGPLRPSEYGSLTSSRQGSDGDFPVDGEGEGGCCCVLQ